MFGDKNQQVNSELTPSTVVYGVEDTFKVKDSDDLIVVGRMRGTIRQGDAVYVSNLGDDNGSTFLTTVKRIEINREVVDEATDCAAGLLLDNGNKAGTIRSGTVIFGRNASSKDVHDAYVGSLGAHYIGFKDLVLTDEDLDRMTVNDMAEIYQAFRNAKSNLSAEEMKAYKDRIDRLMKTLVQKALALKEVYIVYSSLTGEPYMFSRTFKDKDSMASVTPPDVMLITQTYYWVMKDSFSTNGYELHKIENGEDCKGIYNELGRAFYINGACGIILNGLSFAIDCNSVVAKPDTTNVPEISVPVTNPDLVRWFLLMGQFINVETEAAKFVYGLYYGFMKRELLKAKFLIPIAGDLPRGDEAGDAVLEKGSEIILPVDEGKNGRKTIRAFTDWYRLRKVFDDEKWGGMIQPLEGMIESYDFSINVTDHQGEGIYISKDTYDSIRE